MESSVAAPAPEEVMRIVQELEAGHAQLRDEMSKLKISGSVARRLGNGARQRSHSVSPQRSRFGQQQQKQMPRRSGERLKLDSGSSPLRREGRGGGESSRDGVVGGGIVQKGVELSDRQYLNILQSMGQSVHIIDVDRRVLYWNRAAENLYGYSAAEALGRHVYDLILDVHDYAVADHIIEHVMRGEKWTGQFPVRNKLGNRFLVIATDTPFYDDDGSLIGIIIVSSDSRPFQEIKMTIEDTKILDTDLGSSRSKNTVAAKLGLDSDQPLPTVIASKITNLASNVSNRVLSRIKSGEKGMDNEAGSGGSHLSDSGSLDAFVPDTKEEADSIGASTQRGDPSSSRQGLLSQPATDPGKTCRESVDEQEGKNIIQKIISSKTEALIGKKPIPWPWKGNERDVPEAKNGTSPWPSLHGNQDGDHSDSTVKEENQAGEWHRTDPTEASGTWSSNNVNTMSSVSSGGSTSSSALNRADAEDDSSDYEIRWEELKLREHIGQGSCGTVYHGLWHGSDVAVKVFTKLEYTEDALLSFKQEVSVMKRLRHPNILLFMGAVTSTEHLCIVTEFLPRGSLFRLLQRSTSKLDWKRRIHMALDIARGMNYLHHCNPPIIHRHLKSSNLLVDKNWTVKVADFGLSHIKHETYLTTKTGKDTPQWMAPEVLRNEPSDEKSDIYSYGVILWELVTKKIPWENLNPMQVIGAVGFMNQRLDLPKDIDPRWAAIIESCWLSEPQSRPTFQELLEKLKGFQRQYVVQSRSASADAAQIEE
ncbi:putative serine/threonine-protein kinase SIS8 [Drosera capensis]